MIILATNSKLQQLAIGTSGGVARFGFYSDHHVFWSRIDDLGLSNGRVRIEIQDDWIDTLRTLNGRRPE